MDDEDLQLSIARLLEVGQSERLGADLEATLRRLLVLARELMGAHLAALALVEDGPGAAALTLASVSDGRVDGSTDVGDEAAASRLERTLAHWAALYRARGSSAASVFRSKDRFAVVSPVPSRGQVAGVLCFVRRADAGEYTDSDQRTLGVVTAWATFAVERARLGVDADRRKQDSERAARQLIAAQDVASAVGRRTNRTGLFSDIARRTLESVGARAALVWLLDGHRLLLRATSGVPTGLRLGEEMPVSGHASVVLLCGRPLHSTVDRAGALLRGASASSLGDGEATLLVPMALSKAPIGILVAAGCGDRSHFSLAAERRIARFAPAAAAATVLSGAVLRDGVSDHGLAASLNNGLPSDYGRHILAGLRLLIGSADRPPNAPKRS